MGGKDDTGGILGAHVSEESEARKILENGLIESYIDEIDAIIKIINTMVASGIKWTEIWKNMKDEKKRGNPFANLIHSIDLMNNRIVVMLNPKGEDASNESPTQLVEIDISLTGYQNSEVQQPHAIKCL